MRTPLLAANWKMNMTRREARVMLEDLVARLGEVRGRQVAVCPPFQLLGDVGALLEGRPAFSLGAQDLFWEDAGAYTGEVSAPMLRDMGCRFVIIGHSERRAYFGETDESCSKKVAAASSHGLIPILCVGESLEEREAGHTRERVVSQLRGALQGYSMDTGEKLVIAYEPIWAIGTGKTETPPEADRTMGLLRSTLGEIFGERVAGQVRILYGGSVKADNVDAFLTQPHIDGALVGGASLKADSFSRIVQYQEAPVTR